METFRLFGYYTSRISKSLSIISLNTQDFFNPDTKNDDQFLSQLNWLEEVFENLVKLEMKTSIPQKVMILGK